MRGLKYLSNWYYQRINGKVLLLASAIFITFMLLVLPQMAKNSNLQTGTAVSPDTSFYYSADDLYEFAEIYGEAGRDFYIRTRYTFDLVWPLVYLFFLTAMITFLIHPNENSSWRLLNLLPLAGVVFDLAENTGASIVMYRYPQKTPVIAELTPVLTMLKWLAVYVSFLAILTGLAIQIWTWARLWQKRTKYHRE